MNVAHGFLLTLALAAPAAAQIAAPNVPSVTGAQTSDIMPGYDPARTTGDVCARVQRRPDGGWIVRRPIQLPTAAGGAYGVLRLAPGETVDGGRLPGVGALDTACGSARR